MKGHEVADYINGLTKSLKEINTGMSVNVIDSIIRDANNNIRIIESVLVDYHEERTALMRLLRCIIAELSEGGEAR